MHNWRSVFGCSPFTFAGQSVWIVLLLYIRRQIMSNRQISRRMDTHGIIVVERFATFHYY